MIHISWWVLLIIIIVSMVLGAVILLEHLLGIFNFFKNFKFKDLWK